MAILCSNSAKGFFDNAIHSKEQIPADAIVVSDAFREEIMNAQSDGKTIDWSSKMPVAIDSLPITDEQHRNEDNNIHRKYLAATDWYVVRYIETGTPIPDEISDARIKSRNAIV